MQLGHRCIAIGPPTLHPIPHLLLGQVKSAAAHVLFMRLTHLDLGNTQLQLVEPLTPGHPLQAWLAKNGAGLHHFCLKVNDVDEAMKTSPVPTAAPNAHQGKQGKRAV